MQSHRADLDAGLVFDVDAGFSDVVSHGFLPIRCYCFIVSLNWELSQKIRATLSLSSGEIIQQGRRVGVGLTAYSQVEAQLRGVVALYCVLGTGKELGEYRVEGCPQGVFVCVVVGCIEAIIGYEEQVAAAKFDFAR